MNRTCNFCDSSNLRELLSERTVPFAQNFVFDTQKSAQTCAKGLIRIVKCLDCGTTFNSRFNKDLIVYDDQYQNEQQHSKIFQNHLSDVISLIKSKVSSLDSTINEVGCGKGYFIEALREAGYRHVVGFDSAYEGNDPHINQKHFGPGLGIEKSDLLVLRHVLEHIERPKEFLLGLAEANHFEGQIYIEVPDMSWIREHRAFWDFYHEHVNYFDESFFLHNFKTAKVHKLFGGQYLGVFLDLTSLKDYRLSNAAHTSANAVVFDESVRKIKLQFDKWSQIYIWGASSKGVLLCNFLDPLREKIVGLVDINPRKWHKFIPGTGHQILCPDDFLQIRKAAQVVVVVANTNYLSEVKSLLGRGTKVISIEELV